MARTLCNQCKEKTSNRPGGLCSVCYRLKNAGNPAEPPEADDVDLYAAMKHVLSGASCVSPLQKSCKAWLKEKTSAFMDRFAVLEAAKLGSEAKRATDEPDEGHDAAMRVAQDWLRENGVQQ